MSPAAAVEWDARQPSCLLNGAPRSACINELQPGAIDTEMTQGNPEGVQKVVDRGIPLGRVGRGDEIATAIAFLLSDDASYITGAHLAVDGGFLI